MFLPKTILIHINKDVQNSFPMTTLAASLRRHFLEQHFLKNGMGYLFTFSNYPHLHTT